MSNTVEKLSKFYEGKDVLKVYDNGKAEELVKILKKDHKSKKGDYIIEFDDPRYIISYKPK